MSATGRPHNQSPSALTVADVAADLNISPKSVYRMVHDGSLKAYKVRGALRFKPADVERAMKPVKVYSGSEMA